MMNDYRDLYAWQRAMDLVAHCYRLTKEFPADERFGLVSQCRRAAVSVPSNIAEGFGRGSRKAFANHLWIANGSLRELETQLLIAVRLGFLKPDAVRETSRLAAETGRLIIGLRRSLQKKRNPPPDTPESP